MKVGILFLRRKRGVSADGAPHARQRHGGAISPVVFALVAGLLAASPLDALAAGPSKPGDAGGQVSLKPNHQILRAGADSWSAVNPEQGLALMFTAAGIDIRGVRTDDTPWRVHLAFDAIGPVGAVEKLSAPALEAREHRLDFLRASLVESYANTRRGLEVAIQLDDAPPELLELRFGLDGTLAAKTAPEEVTLLLLDAGGSPVLALGELAAHDADGRPVFVRWTTSSGEPGSQGVSSVELDARDHSLPIAVTALLARDAAFGAEAKPRRTPAREDTTGLLAAPSNDQCSGAEVIPAAGPFPHLTGAYNITDATSTGDPPSPTCQSLVSRSIWFKFTPSVAGDYNFSLCSDSPTSTTVEDTVIAVYTSSNGTCGGVFNEVAGYCDDDSCLAGELQSVLTEAPLEAGTTYFVVAYLFDTPPPPAGADVIQLSVSKAPPPPAPPANDQCSGAATIPATGPFPYLTTTVADITGATSTGDPPAPTCQASVSRSTWWTFTPAESASYGISTCADAPTGTTVDDTVLALYTSSNNTCFGTFTQVAGACDNDSCGVEPAQAVLYGAPLTAGVKYYILAYKAGPTSPAAGNTALQLRITKNPPGPPNDFCSGAEVIPGGGPFPALSTITDDVTWATASGDPPLPSCQYNVSRSIWYKFTPQVSGSYSVSVCSDAPTATTADDTVLAVYTSSDGTCGGTLSQVGGACDDDSCTSEANQSAINPVSLTAGVPYYILVYQYGAAAPAPGHTGVQVRVGSNEAPLNDRCSTAIALALDSPVTGTTLLSTNDYQLSGSACFTGVGQGSSSAPGKDVVYRFPAPFTGRFSFRVTGYSTVLNPVLYAARDCPAGASPTTIGSCLKAANRNVSSGAEEVDCLSLVAGQQVYLYVDENADSAGSSFAVEVNSCDLESEPNGTPATAGALTCGVEAAIAVNGDVDFFSLGSPAVNSRVFAAANGVAANSQDFDLRVTTTADTLEYDDANNDVPIGGLAPNVAGTPLTGAASYLRVTHYSAAIHAEPYRLYAAVQPPSSSARAEVEPNNTIAEATTGTSLYFSGGLSSTSDVDIFAFDAVAGQLAVIGLDLDAARNNTPFNGALALLDSTGATLVVANDSAATSSTTPGTGNLAATTPFAPGEAIIHRIRSSGRHYARVTWSSGTPGDYLLSITRPCSSDGDADGVPDQRDCAPSNPTVWYAPGPATGLRFPDAPASAANLAWSAPTTPAGVETRYDVLRSNSASSFAAPVCVAKDVLATTAADAGARPSPGAAYFYIVRTRNTCGTNAGTSSSGAPRSAGACP